MKMLTKIELGNISESIDSSIERIKFLDSKNKFENEEIQILKEEVRASINLLKKMAKIARINKVGLRLI